MRSLNRVLLIGNLGVDPELRHTPSGQAVASFRMATTDTWGGRDGGAPQERTEWHRIVAWAKLGEICNQYLRKGSKVFIEGRLQTRQWQDQKGETRYTTEIVAQNMIMLGGKGEGGGGGGGPAEPAAERASSRTSRPEFDPGGPEPMEPMESAGQGFGEDDSDLPF